MAMISPSVSKTYILSVYMVQCVTSKRAFVLITSYFSFTILTVLGFGANVLTVLIIAVLGISKRDVRTSWRVSVYGLFFNFLL